MFVWMRGPTAARHVCLFECCLGLARMLLKSSPEPASRKTKGRVVSFGPGWPRAREADAVTFPSGHHLRPLFFLPRHTFPCRRPHPPGAPLLPRASAVPAPPLRHALLEGEERIGGWRRTFARTGVEGGEHRRRGGPRSLPNHELEHLRHLSRLLCFQHCLLLPLLPGPNLAPILCYSVSLSFPA